MLIKKRNISFYLSYAIIAAILYAIPTLFFIRDTQYSQAWLLYLGNAFFLAAMVVAVIALNKRYGGNATTRSLIVGGHVITIIGVVIACIIALILLMIYEPELFQSRNTGVVLEGKPANSGNLFFIIIISALVVNFAAGSFASFMFPYTVKRNQTTERGKNVSDPLV